MPETLAAPMPRYVKLANYAILVLLFTLPCVIGRVDTYLVLIAALLVMLTPSVRAARRQASPDVTDLVFVVTFLALAVSFVVTAEDGRDLLFIFNFAPFLVAIPFRWQLQRLARTNGALIIGWLSLAGVIGAAGLAVQQNLILGYSRVGQPIMSVFQYADTAMLLGFMALAGWFAPGTHNRLPFLAGPLIGIGAVLLSGTRGALIGAPVLLILAFGFALFAAKRKGPILAGGVAAVVLLGIAVLVAPMLGFGRAVDGFIVALRLFAGGPVDVPTQERLIMLMGGLGAFLNAPLFGYGWLDMVPAITPYVPASAAERMLSFRHLHNGAMSFAVGAGSVGLLCFLALSVVPVVAVLRTPRDAQFVARLYLASTLCLGFLVFQLTIIMIGFEFHTVQYAFMTMAIVAFARDPAPAYLKPGNSAVGSATANTV